MFCGSNSKDKQRSKHYLSAIMDNRNETTTTKVTPPISSFSSKSKDSSSPMIKKKVYFPPGKSTDNFAVDLNTDFKIEKDNDDQKGENYVAWYDEHKEALILLFIGGFIVSSYMFLRKR